MSLMYKVCFRTIARGNYPEDMAMRVNVFYGGGLISTEEYNLLMDQLNQPQE
ncbi:MAG: hypothetical protein IKC28_01235 [Clostridia bacterium]|nr:hypothetical protein [Clostridia bacterium]